MFESVSSFCEKTVTQSAFKSGLYVGKRTDIQCCSADHQLIGSLFGGLVRGKRSDTYYPPEPLHRGFSAAIRSPTQGEYDGASENEVRNRHDGCYFDPWSPRIATAWRLDTSETFKAVKTAFGAARTEQERGKMRKSETVEYQTTAKSHSTSENCMSDLQPHRQTKSWFHRFSSSVSTHAGQPSAFLGAVLAVALWGMSGFWFDFGQTWQLVINTVTTIITFWMVFLIQGTQNRSEQAIQAKLDELIVATKTASNDLLGVEEKGEEKLAQIHKHHMVLAAKSRIAVRNRRVDDSSSPQ